MAEEQKQIHIKLDGECHQALKVLVAKTKTTIQALVLRVLVAEMAKMETTNGKN
jgi:hypothetical protein